MTYHYIIKAESQSKHHHKETLIPEEPEQELQMAEMVGMIQMIQMMTIRIIKIRGEMIKEKTEMIREEEEKEGRNSQRMMTMKMMMILH